jgi:transmembrane sensor
MEEALHYIDDLIIKSIRGELQESEQQELEIWLNVDEDNRLFFNEITNEDNLIKGLKEFDEASQDAEIVEVQGLQAYYKEIAGTPPPRYTWLKRFTIAASLLLLIIPTIYYFLFNQAEKTNPTVTDHKPKPKQQQITTDVQPGVTKATLTLDDGQQIVLDSAINGQIAQQGNIIINNNFGELEYKASIIASQNTAIQYNTLSTTKGETYAVILPDGSKVWLNAASSIHYPTDFSKQERRVEITGEAYFEVASLQLRSGEKMPFKVAILPAPGTSGYASEIEVLGTNFNVNAYADEPVIKTTLLEGSVKVTAGNEQVTMLPGQQAVISSPATKGSASAKAIKINRNIDTSQAIAWKNGVFDFNNTDLKTVMRQIARWYNLGVVYPTEISKETFIGKIHRNTKIAGVLAILDSTSNLRFEIIGRTIIVKP